MNKRFSRRDFLKLAGGVTLTVAGATFLPQFCGVKHYCLKVRPPPPVITTCSLQAQTDGSIFPATRRGGYSPHG